MTFTGTVADIRALSGTTYDTVFTTDYGGGVWNLDPSDTTSIDNTGTVLVDSTSPTPNRYKRVYSGYVDVTWFGAVGNGTKDDTCAFQNAIDYCVTNRARPKTLFIPQKNNRYMLSSDLEIKVRDTTVQYNPAKFSIIGEQGKGGRQGNNVGVTLYRKGGPGSIIRICEESDGTFPGGGKDVVTRPLNFLRSVIIKGINFVGYETDSPNTVNGISGRSIDNSVIENCGFAGLKFAIKFGTGEENVPNEIAPNDGNPVTLDYCERNLITRCSFQNTKKHIFISSPDISTITQCFFSGLMDNEGEDYVLYWSAGNDYLTFSKNIIHSRTSTSPSTPVDKAIRCYATRGVLFEENHFEGLSNKLFSLNIVEDVEVRNNLIMGNPVSGYNVENVFVISGKEYARINIHDNNIALPTITDNFLSVSAVSDDGSNTKLKTFNVNFRPNKSTTSLGGSTPLALTSNLDALFIENGQAFNPQRIGRNYIFSDAADNLRIKPVASGEPISNADGLALSTAGVIISPAHNIGFGLVPANSQVAYGFTLAVTGAAVGDFVVVTPATRNGLILSAVVTSANLITAYATNPTTGDITPPTISIRFAIIKTT